MRSYDETDSDDVEAAQESRAEPWMLDLLKRNPDYPHWGPYEDYMANKSEGWGGRVIVETWKDFGPWGLDDYNECANFYFYVERESRDCEACGQTGLNPATRQIADDFYDFAETGRRWCDRITQDEVDALLAAGRLMNFTHSVIPGEGWKPDPSKPRPTAEDVNRAQAPGNIGRSHDAINRHILIRIRATRLGVYGTCAECSGQGSVYTSETARIGLVLWMLHPRKGASRGVDVKNIRQDEVPAVVQWLREAATRNEIRFSRILRAL